MDEITVTGAPAIVTALGMGTVFLCLVLLHPMTHTVGKWLPGLLCSAERTAAVEDVEPEERPAAPAGEGALAGAVTLALARHRSSRGNSVVEEPRGADPWKTAGRIRALGVR